MPYVNVTTNTGLDDQARKSLAGKLSALAAALTGKPETYVMAVVRCDEALLYSGSDAPAAYVEFKSIGLDEGGCAALSEGLCTLLEAEAGISAQRVYIEFKDLQRNLFGWNKGTF